MRISDWSSDVCSSDLAEGLDVFGRRAAAVAAEHLPRRVVAVEHVVEFAADERAQRGRVRGGLGAAAFQRRQDAFAVVEHQLARSEEHTSELQSLMRISYAVFCLKKKKQHNKQIHKQL